MRVERKPPDKNAFLRRMRFARIRQFLIAVLSLIAATLVLYATSPSEIGSFAFYAIILLLVANATMALVQFQRIIRPITKILMRLQALSEALQNDTLPDVWEEHHNAWNAFSDLRAGIATILTDLIERIRQDKIELRLKQNVIATIPIAIVTINKDGKVHEIFQKQEGVKTVATLRVGEDLSTLLWGDQNGPDYHTCVEQAFLNDKTLWHDFQVLATDGSTRHYRFSFRKMDTATVLVTFADTTYLEREAHEKTSTVTSRARINRQVALRQFATSIAHDAKNVFAVLKNMVEIGSNSTDSQIRDSMPIVNDVINRGTSLMRELMTFSGEARYNLTCVKASEMLYEIVRNQTIKALCPKNIELFINIPENLPYVDIDREQIWKIPFNLVKNAIEAMGDAGGRIWLKAEPFEMTASTAQFYQHSGSMRLGPGVLITRADDGPGLPPQMMDHLFDPYFSSKGAGRGLGLATVMAIVNAHAGAIRVVSNPGHGTAFLTWLPVSRNSPEELKMIHENAPNGEILLVDDDPMILRTTAIVLKLLKIAAHPAANESDALRKLHSLNRRLRAVLVDANLNGAPSTELIRQIKAERPDLPVILCSGDTKASVASIFSGVPYDDYLEKPYTVNEFAKVLHLYEEKE